MRSAALAAPRRAARAPARFDYQPQNLSLVSCYILQIVM